MKIIISVSTLIIILAGGIFVNYMISVNRYRVAISNITYENVNASNVPNGSYMGECDVDFIYAKVEVTVNDGIITGIQLIEHRHDRGAAAEGIENEIVAQQKIDIDAVSGATNSSIVIKKAVDNALSSATL